MRAFRCRCPGEYVIEMSLADLHRTAARPLPRRLPPLAVFAALTLLFASAILCAFAFSVTRWDVPGFAALALVAVTALWISGGAATAILGLIAPAPGRGTVPDMWRPSKSTALLVTICGEDPGPLAQHLAGLQASLERAGLGESTTIYVLSDTTGAARIEAEEAAFSPLLNSQIIRYRRRTRNIGRKPGNISDWLAQHGDRHAFMIVLDADSRMTPRRIRKMIWQIDRRPDLGLLQAGIALVPGTTRFGKHQRVAARLMSRNFGRGFAAWTGKTGNYWGHNAIMRVSAFRAAARLPQLSGAAPLGGDLLSHDFVEAAWISRAGWTVELDPDPSGSAENAPQTLADFHRRDRRWCQGNLQHLRLLAEPGLNIISRVHLAFGILSYLVAPVWLLLVALIASGSVTASGALPLVLVALVLLVPKLCALTDWFRRARTWRRRWLGTRAGIGELVVSSAIAPLVMLRQSAAVASVCLGQDCGWKSGGRTHWSPPAGWIEACIGAGLLWLAAASGGSAAIWLMPVVLPLIAAPMIVRVLNAPV